MEKHELLLEVTKKLASIGPIVRIEATTVLLVGDTHGYPDVSEWALKIADEAEADRIVFLGDYVDRGPKGVENIELLAEKMLSDERILLLRGNHESLLMNSSYGFSDEAVNKRGREYLKVVEEFYRNLPLIGLMDEGIMLVHGGIPCRLCKEEPEDPITVNDIEDTLKKLWGTPELDGPSDQLVTQILWNDPSGAIEWFLPSPRGPGTYLYGRSAWREFMEKNGLMLIIRAHETVDAVEVWKQDGSLTTKLRHDETLNLEDLKYSVITVFSSCYHGQGAGALLLDTHENTITVLRYPEVLPRIKKKAKKTGKV